MAEHARRVLVVEDDDVIRLLVVDTLDLAGYTVRAARDGEEALAILEDWIPNLIVLDLMMPQLDGWQFRAEQRKRAPIADVPVIVLSASRDLENRTAKLVPAAIVVKPFDLAPFLQTVQRVIATA